MPFPLISGYSVKQELDDDHLSGTAIARGLKRPFGLALDRRLPRLPSPAVPRELLPHDFTLTCPVRRGPKSLRLLRGVAVCFCCDREPVTRFAVPPPEGRDFPWDCSPPLLAVIAFDAPCGAKSVRTFLPDDKVRAIIQHAGNP